MAIERKRATFPVFLALPAGEQLLVEAAHGMDVVQLLFPLKKAFPKIDWTLSELYMGTKRLDWMDTVDRQGIEPGSRILIGFRQLVAKS